MHCIIAVFQRDPKSFHEMMGRYLENDPRCVLSVFDWYSFENGHEYYKPFKDEVPDDTGYFRKHQYNYQAKNALGESIILKPYAFITPDGLMHQGKEWEDWINNKDDPYCDFADCYVF